jgi:nucleotide-binding universal stress UspA family protein
MQPTQAVSDALGFDARSLFDRVLVPVDFSEGSRRALAAALELRRQFGSEVHLFWLTEASENDQFLAGTGAAAMSPRGLIEAAEGRLNRFVDNVFPGSAGEVIVHAKVGADVLHAIARTAKGMGMTLVVLAQQPKHTVLRTQIEKLVRELDSAVLILRTPPEMQFS